MLTRYAGLSMSNQRDEFTDATRQTLGERAAWRCGFPGCETPTVGPSDSDDKKSIRLGEAAHITAAASEGPRYDTRLGRDERRSVENGIYMCRHHARLIDADDASYSPQTLRLWKADIERLAGDALRRGHRTAVHQPSTLVACGFNLVFHAHWAKGGGDEWQFDCSTFVRGDERALIDYIENYHKEPEINRFVIIESQGDGRALAGAPTWHRNGGVLQLHLPVHQRVERGNPMALGEDIAIGQDGDIRIENGDFAVVSGVNNAIQKLSTMMGTSLGDWFMRPQFGSLCALYFDLFPGDKRLLERLFALEFARLATIPIDVETPDPLLNFVWRVENVSIESSELNDSRRLLVLVGVEWANGEHWSGTIPIYISTPATFSKLPAWIRR